MLVCDRCQRHGMPWRHFPTVDAEAFDFIELQRARALPVPPVVPGKEWRHIWVLVEPNVPRREQPLPLRCVIDEDGSIYWPQTREVRPETVELQGDIEGFMEWRPAS